MDKHDDAWHAKRRESVGASEAYDLVLGRLHKIWLRKTGRDEPEPDSDDAVFGRMMEGAVLDRYEQVTGARLERQAHIVHPSIKRASATPDGIVTGSDSDGVLSGNIDRVVEVKCPRYSRGWGPAGSQAIPPRVWWQVQQQMICCYAPVADVVALLHREVRIYRDIPANPEAQGLLLAEIESFWERHVAPDVAPAPDDSEQCASYLASLYPHAPEDRQVQACDDAEVAAAARDYARAKRAADDAEAGKRRAKAVLVGRIGAAYGIEGDWGTAISANVAGRKKVDYAALCLDLMRAAGDSPEAAQARLRELEQRHTTVGGSYRRLDVTLKDAP